MPALVVVAACVPSNRGSVSTATATLLSVDNEDRVHLLPDDHPHIRTAYRLQGHRIVDDQGAEYMACRDGALFHGSERVIALAAHGFGDVRVDRRSVATFARPDGRVDHVQFRGVAVGDICIEAMLFEMTPAANVWR